MALKRVELQVADVRLGDGFETGFMTLANEKAIKESGRLFLKVFGDQLERTRSRERHHVPPPPPGGGETNLTEDRAQGRFSQRLKRVANTVDTVLEWLEYSAKDLAKKGKKHEMVLRGVFNLTDIGNQASVFAALEAACSFLNKPNDAFPALRDIIRNSLKDMEKKHERIQQLVDEAGEILKAIIYDERVDNQKGIQFDNIVREAHLEILACRRRLNSNETKINELSTKMTTIKWFSRAFRFVAWGFAGYCLYQKFREADFFVLKFGGGFAVATGVCLCMYPSQTYEFHRSLLELDWKHSELTEKIDDLRGSLCSAKDYNDGFMGVKSSTV